MKVFTKQSHSYQWLGYYAITAALNSHRDQLGVLFLTQGHFNMETAGADLGATILLIRR